jgi:cell division transport system ATP-binding protein
MEEFPTEGQIVVGSFVCSRMNRRRIPMLRRKVGMIFQDFRLMEDRTVFENVAIALHVAGKRGVEIKHRVMQVLHQVGLTHMRNRLPRELSGGEQQRVAIARAVVNEPVVLLADEPTGNLDPVVTEEILRLLFKINAAGTAVLMATHDLALVQQFGQRILHLDEGRLVGDVTTGFVGNLGDRLDRIQRERERKRRQEES